jgi:hypothetical protein
MSLLPEAGESKTISVPSGDQRGDPLRELFSVVNCAGPEPSLAATQISK